MSADESGQAALHAVDQRRVPGPDPDLLQAQHVGPAERAVEGRQAPIFIDLARWQRSREAVDVPGGDVQRGHRGRPCQP
jgi:hypothetical protein